MGLFSSSDAIDRARSHPVCKIHWLQDVTLVHLFSAKPAVTEVIQTKRQLCWPLFEQPQESLRLFQHVIDACDAPVFLCLVHIWGNPIHSLWYPSVIYSDSISSTPTTHNDPCCSASQPFSRHLAPSSFTFSCWCPDVSLLCFTHTHTRTTGSSRCVFQPCGLCVCLFLCFYNPNPHAPLLIQSVWEC